MTTFIRRQTMTLLLTAILTVPVGGHSAEPSSAIAPVAATLGVGDTVQIEVFRHPDLSGEFEIAADGGLTLPLIGRVDAADSRLAELETRLLARYKDGFLKQPNLRIRLLSRRPFYILGGVRTPGSYPYQPGLNVMMAVAMAGGYLPGLTDDLRSGIALAENQSRLSEYRNDYRAAQVRKARLLAEQRGDDALSLPEAMKDRAEQPLIAGLVEDENSILTTRKDGLENKIDILTQQIAQYREEIEVSNAQIKAVERQMSLLDEQLDRYQKIVKKGLVSKSSIVDLQSSDADLDVQRLELRASISRSKQSIGEAELNIVNLRNSHQQQVAEQLQQVNQQLVNLEDRIAATGMIVRQTALLTERAASEAAVTDRPVLTITRTTGQGSETLSVVETTPVQPGDVIRIPSMTGAPTPALSWSGAD